MSEHKASVVWQRHTPEFTYETYDRNHEVTLGNGSRLDASAAAEFRGDPTRTNPEEVFVAALSSCHMLTFLAIAARAGFVVESYVDHAVGTLGRLSPGRMGMTGVVLKPEATFGGDRRPTREEVIAMHEKAHQGCFIANSVSCPVSCEPG